MNTKQEQKRHKGFQKYRGLFYRYFFICVFLMLFFVGVLFVSFTGTSVMHFQSEQYDSMKHAVLKASEAAADSFRSADGRFSVERLAPFYRLIAEITGADLFLVDPAGQIVFCTNPNITAHVLPQALLQETGETIYTGTGTLEGVYTDQCYISGIVVQDTQKTVIGYAYAASPMVEFQEFRGQLMPLFMTVSLIFIALAFVIIYATVYRMVRPLHQMADAAGRFGRGDFTQRLPVDSQDEIGQLAEALNNMAEELALSEHSRRSFIANVSHELKTPMQTISGFIDGILDGTIPPENQRYYLRIVSDEVKRLGRMVRSMLNLARLEEGSMELSKNKVNIVDLTVQTLLNFEDRIEKRHPDIRGLDQKKMMVRVDEDMMSQVIYNLIDNAIKFSEEGGYIEFVFRSDFKWTYVTIRNGGKGIAKEDLPQIFDRFYKSDKSRSQDTTGVGLGLHIVRSIVRLHGGDITVRSKENQYTEFEFSIPSA